MFDTDTTHDEWFTFYHSGRTAAGRDLAHGEADSALQAACAVGFLATAGLNHMAWWAGYHARITRHMGAR